MALIFQLFAETVDEAQIQRASLVGDVKFNDDGLALNGFAGRLGDDYFSSQIKLPDLSAQRANIFSISTALIWPIGALSIEVLRRVMAALRVSDGKSTAFYRRLCVRLMMRGKLISI